MNKIKIYGSFIALVFSLFFNIISYNNSHIPKDEAAAKSQIRVSLRTEEEKIIIPLRSYNEKESNISNNHSATEPPVFLTKLRERLVSIKPKIYSEVIPVFKSLSTERYRVLRN